MIHFDNYLRMKNLVLSLYLSLLVSAVLGQADHVAIRSNQGGMKLVVNGQDFFIKGMNWDYFPIGTNYDYNLWKQPGNIIRAALDAEMSLLKNMGINAIRQYTGVPARWIRYIYEKYGIYTMLNHSFGRYGLTLDGAWVGNTEYADFRTRALLLQEVRAMAEAYRDTPGLLLYLLGNENNYGLFWEGAETEDIPVQDRQSTERAKAMYQLFNEAAVAMKSIDQSHPIALCNGDLLFLEIIAETCPDFDIFGTNMYRGSSFGDAFQRVRTELNKPILFTEFGADAFNALTNEEDQPAQAHYMVANWQEIYANVAGLGQVGNSLGGFTFQFSDGWWKFGQTSNLEVHDNNASWSNGGYLHDFVEGKNNMNEEWFGICAKGPTNKRGLYQLYPRAAYYALKEVHQLNPFAKNTTLAALEAAFGSISLVTNRAVIAAKEGKPNAGGTLTPNFTGKALTPEAPAPTPTYQAANVIALFSDAYSNIVDTNFNPNGGQVLPVPQVAIAGNQTLLYSRQNDQGLQLRSEQDVSGMTHLHLDCWTGSASELKIFLISPGPAPKSISLTIPASSWTSIDIPLTEFMQVIDLSKGFQFKFEGNGEIYFDNILLFKKS